MKDRPTFSLAPTVPCSDSLSTSIATEVIDEVRVILAQLPTGAWRRSVNRRISEIEGAVDSWDMDEPPTAQRKQITANALALLSELVAE